MKEVIIILLSSISVSTGFAQVGWLVADSLIIDLPKNVTIYTTTDSLDGKPNKAFYLKAKLKDKHLSFEVDTSLGRRFTPKQFYENNDRPIVVVNGSFFNFDKNQNLNVVIKNGEVVAHNIKSVQRKINGKLQKVEIYRSAIGISTKGKADVAWIRTDSGSRIAFGRQAMDSYTNFRTAKIGITKRSLRQIKKEERRLLQKNSFKQWKMYTAIGGGPMLVQDGKVKIYNDEEKQFDGKQGLIDKHPRTAMGYTADGYLIILVIEGRNPGIAEGASLEQEAKMLVNLGCVEALNLDGGGSSCMLVNGRETIKPSDKEGQRPVPAVFIIKGK